MFHRVLGKQSSRARWYWRGAVVDRRGLLKDVTEVGIGLGATGSLVDERAALAATSPRGGRANAPEARGR
jgi:hypothetical protein